jgi:hypothetical protein
VPTLQTAVDPLGRTLELDDGDLAVVADPAGAVTLAELRGIGALSQTLTLALETQLGSDPMHAGYGLDATALGAGGYGLRSRREYLKLQLVRCIAGDTRVNQILELIFDEEGRASRSHAVTALIETRAGDQLGLEIGAPRA